MIRVVKPVEAPIILTTVGKLETDKNNRRYSRRPQVYAIKALPIENGIYNNKTVKDALRIAQCNKCCFCETSQIDQDAAVEHYRPKRGYSSSPKGKTNYPGYYWLCYKWDNLYLICTACNRAKTNYFPLTDNDKRAKSHRDDVHEETPYIIDPGGSEDPRAHLAFDRHLITAKSELGRRTIEACGLNRLSLTEERREFLQLIRELTDLYKVLVNDSKHEDLLNKLIARLKIHQDSTKRFSAAVTDFLYLEGIILH